MYSFKRNRRLSKIRREKPQLWHIPNLGLGYIQIPKVATRSTRQALFKYLSESELEIDSEVLENIESGYSSHLATGEMREQWPGLYIFAFVRHPLDRLYSCYKNKVLQPQRTGARNLFWQHNIEIGMPFEKFVEQVCKIPDREIDRHLRSQHTFLYAGETLVPDYVGRLESLEESWQFLQQRFPLPDLEQINASDDFPQLWKTAYTNDLAEMAATRYEKDIKLFGYESA